MPVRMIMMLPMVTPPPSLTPMEMTLPPQATAAPLPVFKSIVWMKLLCAQMPLRPELVGLWTPLRYWGVFAVGTSPTYTVTYNYDGHPGISNEDDLELAYRGNHSVNAWADLDATLETGANTLTKTGESGTEYALGSPQRRQLPACRALLLHRHRRRWGAHLTLEHRKRNREPWFQYLP